MRRLVVDVHERALHVRERLELVLELLANVVRLPQRRIRGHHHVDLEEVLGPALRYGSASIREERGGRRGEGELTWYARTVSICSISSLNVMAL